MLLSLGHELLCAIVEHVSLRPHILQIAGTCRALSAAVLAHSCWHNVELVGKSLEELEFMCFLRVPLRRLTLTFGILESPLVLHLLESCGAAQLEHLTLRRVVGFYHASLGGAAGSNSAEVLAGQCRVASVARGVHRCDDRLIQPGAGFLPLALAATPRLRSFTCSNVDMADLAHLPPLPHLEVADLGAACEASHLVDRYHRDPSRVVPMFSHGMQIPIVLDGMPALTRLRVSGFQFGARLTIRAPALERLESLLKNNVFIARLDCPRLNEVACQHGVRSRCHRFVLLDTYGEAVKVPWYEVDDSAEIELERLADFVPAPSLPEAPLGPRKVPHAVGCPYDRAPSAPGLAGNTEHVEVVELPAGCRVSWFLQL